LEPPYLAIYSVAADASIPNYKAGCWDCEYSQQRRFEVLADLYPVAGKRVLDAGCGRGDLAAYLLDRGIEFSSYVGIDAIPAVVAQARRRSLARSEFHEGDLVVDAGLLEAMAPDVVFLSGTLNTMTPDQALGVVKASWSAAREALVFNFLSDRAGRRAPRQGGTIHRLPTVAILEWAFARTSQVAFRQDYFDHGHDATIRMLKA
jgi:SAM-dependent methyltransferase